MPNANGMPTLQEQLAAQGIVAPAGAPTPTAVTPPPGSNDPLARLEAAEYQDWNRATGNVNANGDILPRSGPVASPIAPPQPTATPTGRMVPIYNAGGDKIGEKPEMAGAPLFQNPLASPPPTFNATTGQPMAPPTAEPAAPSGPATVHYAPTTPNGGLQQQMAGGFYAPAGAGKGGGGPAANPYSNELKALAEARAGAAKNRELELGASERERAGVGQEASQLEKMRNEFVTKQEAQSAKLNQAADSYQKLLQEAPEESIDSHRWWNSRSTGQQILAALIGMSGGISQGLRGGGPNEGVEAINGFIQRDIEEQKHNIALRRENRAAKVEGAKTAYEMLRSQVHDDQAATELAHAWALDRMAVEGKQRALLSGDVATQERWQQAEDALKMQSAQLQDKAAQRLMAGGAGFDRAKFISQKNFYVDKGYLPDEAERMAARDLGVAQLPNAQTGKAGGAGDKTAEARTEAQGLLSSLAGISPEAATKGTSFGAAAAHLPGWVPGVQEARRNVSVREAANVQMMQAAGAAWKMTTGGVEPKNPHLIEEIVAPYKIEATDDAKTVQFKRAQAMKAVQMAAGAKGVAAGDLRSNLAAGVGGGPPAGFRPAGQ
jgi:hypothetical protein